MREKPLRSASDIIWRSVLWRSMNTMSVRGTITSRASVSPSSKTEWIIRLSSDSITRLASARSTSSRSSASEANGPSRKPRPGVSALPMQDQQLRDRAEHGGEHGDRARRHQGDPLGVLAPDVRGPTPTAMYDTTTITPAATTTWSQVGSSRSTTTSVTSTVAVVSHRMRSSSAVLR